MASDDPAPPSRRRIPNVLSIAGSDPSGGAGIQADVKAISACGGYAMAAITALTAQNTRRVGAVETPSPGFVRDQIRTVFEDVRVDAVKIGMIATAPIAAAVADALTDVKARKIVLDPVMIATSGDRLLAEDAAAVLKERLLPLADVVTPNTAEAAALLDAPEPQDRAAMAALGERLRAAGAKAVLIKGGHLDGPDSPDLLLGVGAPLWLGGVRAPGRALHGGGCTLSAALATFWARTDDLGRAAEQAKEYVAGAVAAADRLEVGSGARPLHHLYALWDKA